MRRLTPLLIAFSMTLGISVPTHSLAAPRQATTELAPIIRSLEFLQIDYRLLDEGREIVFEVPTRRYGPPDKPRLWLRAFPFTVGDSPIQWYQLQAAGIYSLSQCRHPDAARRAILETGKELDTDVQFLYDGSDGEVGAQMAIPAPDGKIPANLLQSYIRMIVAAVDQLDPVLLRAMETGFIDWPSRDRGPRQVAGELKVNPSDGSDPFIVAWAPWIEESVLASTIVTLDPFLREFAGMDDEARERLGRDLTGFGGAAGENSFAGWMRIADHLEQSYPPIAFRFWGPPGTRVSATARIEGFCADSTAEGVIDSMGHWDVEIMPLWDIEALVNLPGPRPARVEYTVSCGGQTTRGTKDVTIQPMSVADVGLGFLATAKFVNEDHPWVRSIISEANSLGIARSLGFTGQEPFEDCVRQIYAVWKAMRNRGISYVTIHENAVAPDSPTQTIRQFHEAIVEQGANCADGSAAFASILRKLGFDVWLIHPERHVLVGIDLGERIADPERRWLFLETTLLGDVEPEPTEEGLAVATVESQIPSKHRGEDWGTFLVACESAGSQVQDEDADCEWIRLGEARALGLTPIPAAAGQLGRIPNPPKDLEAMRSPLRDAKRAERRVRDYLFRLPDVPACVPYGDFESVVADIDALESDAGSLRRLLSAIPGDGLVERLARTSARHDAALAPAFVAAKDAFGSLPGRGFETFGIEGSPWEVEVEREADSARVNVRPLDRGIRGNWVRALHEADRWVISGESLMENPAAWFQTAMVEVGERLNPGSLERLGRELADRVNRRELADAASFRAALQSGIEAMLPTEAKLQELADSQP